LASLAKARAPGLERVPTQPRKLNRLWDGRRPQDGHMMKMSYRCCCAAAGMVFLPHSTRPHPSRVPTCSVGTRLTKFDMLALTGTDRVRLVRTTVIASAADTSELRVLRARLTCRTSEQHFETLWTSLLGCGVLLRSLSNQTPRSTCPGPSRFDCMLSCTPPHLIGGGAAPAC